MNAACGLRPTEGSMTEKTGRYSTDMTVAEWAVLAPELAIRGARGQLLVLIPNKWTSQY